MYNSSKCLFPIFQSCRLYNNFLSQTNATSSGSVNYSNTYSTTHAGSYATLTFNDSDNGYLVYPNYGIIVYDSYYYGGSIILNYYNSDSSYNPIYVVPNTPLSGSSCKIFYNGSEITS